MSTSHGYSDRISHAFAFAAKHLPPRARRGSGALHLTQPANVAVILARYGCDEITIISGILGETLQTATLGVSVGLAMAAGLGQVFSSTIQIIPKFSVWPYLVGRYRRHHGYRRSGADPLAAHHAHRSIPRAARGVMDCLAVCHLS